MICAKIISHVESILTNFTEEVEKEEVVTFKTYLRLVIANYAAADFSPAPSKIPIQSRPVKGNTGSFSKEKRALEIVALANPKKIVPQKVEKSWATVTS